MNAANEKALLLRRLANFEAHVASSWQAVEAAEARGEPEAAMHHIGKVQTHTSNANQLRALIAQKFGA